MYSLSKKGLQLTENFEGCRLQAYQDQVGVWTIGYGHTRGVKPGDICTLAQAQQWLLEDVALAEQAVQVFVHVPLSQGEYDALVDFAFNLGTEALHKSHLLQLLNEGNFEASAEEFAKWDHAGGKVVAGLLRRRLAEKEEFQS